MTEPQFLTAKKFFLLYIVYNERPLTFVNIHFQFCFVLFYGTSTIVGYLMPNLFLYF